MITTALNYNTIKGQGIKSSFGSVNMDDSSRTISIPGQYLSRNFRFIFSTVFRYFFTFIFICFFYNSLSAQVSDILTQADQMPYFTGCESENFTPEEKRSCSDKNLIRFIANQLEYPAIAKEKEIEGTVYVSFVVDESGNVISPKLIRDIGGDCGAAALEILRMMPRWEPAIHEGKKVKVELRLPIQYSLKNQERSEKAQTYQINWGSLATPTVSKKILEAHLDRNLHVRDAYGNDKPISELIFSFEKKKTYLEGGSTGKINDQLRKVVNKCKKGGTFSILAVVRVNGDFIYVRRSFEII